MCVRLSHAPHWRATAYECFQWPIEEAVALVLAALGLLHHVTDHSHLLSTCYWSIGLLMKDQIIFWLETKYKYCHVINLNCLLTSLLTCNLPSSTARFISLKHFLSSICCSSCPFNGFSLLRESSSNSSLWLSKSSVLVLYFSTQPYFPYPIM